MQLINKEFGGTVLRKAAREDGQYTIEVDNYCHIFKLVSNQSCGLFVGLFFGGVVFSFLITAISSSQCLDQSLQAILFWWNCNFFFTFIIFYICSLICLSLSQCVHHSLIFFCCVFKVFIYLFWFIYFIFLFWVLFVFSSSFIIIEFFLCTCLNMFFLVFFGYCYFVFYLFTVQMFSCCIIVSFKYFCCCFSKCLYFSCLFIFNFFGIYIVVFFIFIYWSLYFFLMLLFYLFIYVLKCVVCVCVSCAAQVCVGVWGVRVQVTVPWACCVDTCSVRQWLVLTQHNIQVWQLTHIMGLVSCPPSTGWV